MWDLLTIIPRLVAFCVANRALRISVISHAGDGSFGKSRACSGISGITFLDTEIYECISLSCISECRLPVYCTVLYSMLMLMVLANLVRFSENVPHALTLMFSNYISDCERRAGNKRGGWPQVSGSDEYASEIITHPAAHFNAHFATSLHRFHATPQVNKVGRHGITRDSFSSLGTVLHWSAINTMDAIWSSKHLAGTILWFVIPSITMSAPNYSPSNDLLSHNNICYMSPFGQISLLDLLFHVILPDCITLAHIWSTHIVFATVSLFVHVMYSAAEFYCS